MDFGLIFGSLATLIGTGHIMGLLVPGVGCSCGLVLCSFPLLIRGLIPCPATPLLLSASVTLFSMDVPRIRRWRRKAIVAIGRRRHTKVPALQVTNLGPVTPRVGRQGFL